MTEQNHDISLGDLARALRHLKPSDKASRRMIAQLLGFELEEAQATITGDVSAKRDERVVLPPEPETKRDAAPKLPTIEPQFNSIPTRLEASSDETLKPLVYISHQARSDKTRAILNAIRLRLFGDGFDVLLDTERPGVGSVWSEQSGAWLNSCQGAVVLFSTDAIESSFFDREADLIAQRCTGDQDFPVISVLLQPVQSFRPFYLNERQKIFTTHVVQQRHSQEAAAVASEVSRALAPLKASQVGWRPDVSPLPPPAKEETNIPLPFDPLLVPNWTRAILSSALSTSGADGPLDLDKVVEAFARREHLERLPVRLLPTLRRGVQVLVDKSQSMIPFARDASWLQNEIQKVVGHEKAQILRFVGTPLRGAGQGARSKWGDYEPPASGTPVLVLTDLGACQLVLPADWADASEWKSFAEVVHRAGCPLVVLTPYARARWPRSLRHSMTIIQWDQQTTVATVRSLVGRAHEVIE